MTKTSEYRQACQSCGCMVTEDESIRAAYTVGTNSGHAVGLLRNQFCARLAQRWVNGTPYCRECTEAEQPALSQEEIDNAILQAGSGRCGFCGKEF